MAERARGRPWVRAKSPAPAGRPRCVVWLLDSLRLGGAERLALAMAAEPPAGCELTLIALQPPPGAASAEQLWGQRYQRAAHRIIQLDMRRLTDGAPYRRLLYELRRLDPAVIHSHLQYATLWGAAAAAQLGIPQVVTQHCLPAPCTGAQARLRSVAEGLVWRRCARRVFVSEAQADAWLGAGQRHDPRICIAPNGIDLDVGVGRSEARERLGLTAAGPVLLTVAVVRARKGWRTWLQALRLMADVIPSACFVWVGEGGEEAQLRAAVAGDARLQGRVRLPGRCAELSAWLAAADIFLFPSEEEALPTAVIEAMAAGLPVIATNLPAVAEVLGDTGRLVAPGDAVGLSRAAVEWASDADARRRAGAAARARHRLRWSHDAWRSRLGDLYADLVPTRPQTSVLMVEFFSRGGLWHYALQMAQALAAAGAERGWRVSLLTGRAPEMPPPDAGALNAGVAIEARLVTWNPHRRVRWAPARLVRAWRGLRYVAAWIQICAAAERRRPDVLLFGDFEHRCDGWFIALLRARGHRLAVIWHNVAAFDRYSRRRLTRNPAWRTALVRRFDAVFVHGEALAATLLAQTGIRACPIHHGDQSWIAKQAVAVPDLDARLTLPREGAVALLFGTLTKYKGVPVLLEALARIPAVQRPIAVIAGLPAADVDVAALKQQARVLGIEPWVRWQLRYIPTAEVAAYFQRADVVVLPYLAASQSGVAHLALTFGKPLIVTRTGGLPELIEGNGLVVEPGAVEALAQALERLATAPELRREMGARGARLAHQRHDWQVIAGEVIAELAPLLRPRPTLSEPAD